MPDPTLIPIAQAAEIAGVSVKFLISACNHPNVFSRLKSKKIGRKYTTTKEWLNDWINRN